MLRNDKRLIVSAAARAQKAADWILATPRGRAMPEYSKPIADPKQAHKRTADFVVYERTAALVLVHRFATRELADAWTDERLADPSAMDTYLVSSMERQRIRRRRLT